MNARAVLLTIVGGVGFAGTTLAQTDVPAGLHNSSETWTLAGSPYRLKGQVYFTSGTTLTINAGVTVASLPADLGSLAICRGAKIFVNGTQSQPVVMTSTNDNGTWRAACNEWGNLTVMGNAYISENAIGTNTPAPNAGNVANMEGLTNGPSTDQYGGGNDDDDSGSITYLSLRFGGKVVGLNNELNGLSMGGIGRATVVHHIDIMNNVDDGIETWGGTVNYKYLNVWNIGDDGFDVDQGWRGKAQFALLVTGYSVVAATGSGVGDHSTEIDGAEDSDYQPVTTTSLYNFTVIGQPLNPRGMIDWRDNARVQYHNSIFMDAGGEVVKFDNLDGDGAHGYGFNGTLSWAATWTTPYNAVPAHANDFTTGTYATNYPAQTSGFLAEITDSVFFRNQAAAAYTEANLRSVFAGANNNVIATFNPLAPNDNMPIQSLTRTTPGVVAPGYTVFNVATLDPRPANAAMLSVGAAPNDGFYTPAQYRGAFVPRGESWLCGWTASYQFGFTTACNSGTPFCLPGVNGVMACPCANAGLGTNGCDNSSATGGATISSTGFASLSGDTLVFTTAGEKPTATSILLQGNVNVAAGAQFGQGVRCTGGQLKRLYTKAAVGGSITAPVGADLSVSARSSFLGDTILPGGTRYYQTYYRDPVVLGGCPVANTYNITNGESIYWDPVIPKS